MNKILKEKISESVSSVLPITIIVLLLSVTITPMPVGTMVLFLTGAALLIVPTETNNDSCIQDSNT